MPQTQSLLGLLRHRGILRVSWTQVIELRSVAVLAQGGASGEYSLATAGRILRDSQRRQMFFKTQTDQWWPRFISMSIWPGSGSQFPEPLQAFWPDLNSKEGPRGPGIAPELGVESGRLPI